MLDLRGFSTHSSHLQVKNYVCFFDVLYQCVLTNKRRCNHQCSINSHFARSDVTAVLLTSQHHVTPSLSAVVMTSVTVTLHRRQVSIIHHFNLDSRFFFHYNLRHEIIILIFLAQLYFCCQKVRGRSRASAPKLRLIAPNCVAYECTLTPFSRHHCM